MNEDNSITLISVKELIAKGQLEKAADLLIIAATENGLTAIGDKVLVQQSRLAENTERERLGLLDYDDITRTRIQIALSLIEISNQLLVNNNNKKPTKVTGISEPNLKSQILCVLIIGKLIIFIYVFTLWQSGGGLTYDGFLGSIGIIFPVFAAYISLGFQDLLADRHTIKTTNQLMIKRNLQYVTYMLLFSYFASLFMIFHLNATGEIPDSGSSEFRNYKNLYGSLALVESFVGIYIGKLMTSLFKGV